MQNAFIDATMLFELPYMQIWTVLLNRRYTGSVLRELPNKPTVYENP